MNILVYDHGLCLEAACSLARDGHTVKYYSEWKEDFPHYCKASIGEGFEVEHVDNFWDHVPKADVVFFFDTFCEDMVRYLRKQGKLVFGSGKAEYLERHRHFCRDLQQALKLPCPETTYITGVENLITHLKQHDDLYVKLDQYRGDIETFYHSTWNDTIAQVLGEILIDFGPAAKTLPFILEKPIKGAEVGYDGFTLKGDYPNLAMLGYEAKDEGYIGHISPYNQLPSSVLRVNEALSPLFERCESSTFFSSEIIVDKAKKGYLIDPTVRCPHPPLAAMLEGFKNITPFLIEMGKGKLIDLTARSPYAACLIIKSDWAETHWTKIDFPPSLRRFVKFQRGFKDSSGYWCAPGFEFLCTAVGLGSTAQQAVTACKKIANEITCKGKYVNEACLDVLLTKTIPQGIQNGINF